MSSIRMIVDHMPGETATSLVSRLAARNGVPTAEKFCQDHRLKLQNVADGELATIHSLAEIAGVDPNRLFASTFRKMETGAFHLGGESLMQNFMSRCALRACPTCLLEDAAASSLKRDAAMYGRAWWQVAFVRTCHVHGQPLVVFGTGRGLLIHDFTASLRQHAASLPALAANTENREATGLEGYVIRRLTGQAGGVPFLDDLRLGTAARFCEVLGGVQLHGRARRVGKLDDEQLRLSGQAGFNIAMGGESAVRSFIAALLDPAAVGRASNGGVPAALGTLHHWLFDNRRSADQDGLRELVREVVAESMPMRPDKACLGEIIEARRLHSVRTAALETGMHPKRLRKALEDAGFIGADQAGRPDNLMTFPADTSAEFLAKLSAAMPLAKVASYINAPRVQAKLLLDAGFLVPIYPRHETGKRILAFTRSDVDGFMSALSDQAELLDAEKEGSLSIPKAAKRVPCGAMEIVRLVFEKRLSWVGRRSDGSGYLSIRVRPDQIRPILFPKIGISIREAATRLELRIEVVQRLVKFGYIKSVDCQGIYYKREKYIVDQNSIIEFRNKYVAFKDLMPDVGRTRFKVRFSLYRRGITPAIPSSKSLMAFILKSDLEGIFLHEKTKKRLNIQG
ncbi:TniQ family protein [Methylobacterium sp. NEAU K]|uniref:TniQ family protein n=1 Tax=Methylobacterium sp. NEAU K TaxID=3064946 RepID=UPI0027343677|nr:TniQ family protein [Methylobacterium sp. NEAU K]MDP4003665.1 TniQ family protein [Methylobacterium sp. NEAU K]